MDLSPLSDGVDAGPQAFGSFVGSEQSIAVSSSIVDRLVVARPGGLDRETSMAEMQDPDFFVADEGVVLLGSPGAGLHKSDFGIVGVVGHSDAFAISKVI
jgi:hypothetical protein